MEGNNGLTRSLQAYIKQLEENPLRTKMLTAGTLAGAQELIASFLAKDRNKHGNYFTSRVPKMAAYGAIVSAPLGHFLIWALQKTFAGRTSLRAKVLQIIVSNLIVCRLTLGYCGSRANLISLDRTHPELRLPGRDGLDCRRQDLSPGSRNGQGRLLEGNEGQLDFFPAVPGLRPEVPP